MGYPGAYQMQMNHGLLNPQFSNASPSPAAAPMKNQLEQEMKHYINNGVSETTERISDLTREWEHNEHSYPLLFCVAMYVLPVQASAVPCEHVFSSSKETCGLRRSKLSPKLMEALQMLKFSFKQERLSFTGDIIVDEKDYTVIEPVTGAAVAELLEAGKLQELEELLSNTDNNL
ncbi:hypothetical protein DXG01_007724 [Tephrocybe rancida]|nr:hypothetical protein DXG01_007724 [Tephrocybe rancida]